jgi:Flp pilus assembly protein TadD
MFGRRKRQLLGPQPRYSKGTPLSPAERYLERGLHFFEKKKHEDALADLDEAIELAPRDAELYVTRGLIEVEMGQEEDAKTDLEYAVMLDKRQWVGYYMLGMMDYRKQNYRAALDQFERAQPYAPGRAEIYLARAMAHLAVDEAEVAESIIEQAEPVFKELERKDSRYKSWRSLKTELKKRKK